ncbi:MAG: penicillin-binding protein [Oscillospiraceae bacterium]|nr:penicillin-binding protein [Oscillospiraceae bacterium]
MSDTKRPPQEQEKKQRKRRHRKKNKFLTFLRGFFKFLATTVLTIILVVVIILSVIMAALTAYVMQFRENTPVNIDLDTMDLAYTTFIYGYDENGNEVELTHISRDANRIPITLDEIPQHVRDAFVYIEDEHFYEHSGVNWMRTFGAVLNELTGGIIYGNRQGASTITQQTIKNITNDDNPTWDRKLREIFRAHDLEKYRTKDEILEAYLNCIGFGGTTVGIEAAAQKYFGKSTSELDLAEAASLAAIPRSPNTLNPFADKKANKDRQEWVLQKMYDNAAISENQFKAAVEEELQLVDPDVAESHQAIQNWYIDTVIDDVTQEFMKMYGLSYDEANDRLYNGGYRIYTPINIKMQEEVEEKFRNYRTFSPEVVSDPPQAAFIAMDYSGNILAIAGAVGTKSGSNVWNNATDSKRQPASTFKPLAAYSYAIENNFAYWSKLELDSPLELEDPDDPDEKILWPHNYSETDDEDTWSNDYVTITEGLARSLNTVSATLVSNSGERNIYEFVQNKYQLELDPVKDPYPSPMALGALTKGMSLRTLVSRYQVFGGSGAYFEPTSYTVVLDSDGEVVLRHNYTQIQAISPETAAIMNRMMREVIESEYGTGTAAKLSRVAVTGKTGTSQNWYDNLFVCCTPDYVSGVWYGYKEANRKVTPGTYYGTARLWKNIFGDIANEGEHTEFTLTGKVEKRYYCTETGLLASDKCEHVAEGWFKSSFLPEVCPHGEDESLANTNPAEYAAQQQEQAEQ